MQEPLIIDSIIDNNDQFNMKHRVVDAARHARRLLGPRLGYTDAIDRFTGHQGFRNIERLISSASNGEIGLAVMADDPEGNEAGLVVAEKRVTATSDLVAKTGIFITAWFVGKKRYEKELVSLTEVGVEMAKSLELKIGKDENCEGIFALERINKDEKVDNGRLTRFKNKALTVIEAPVDETALDVVHDVIEGVGFTAIAESSWKRTRETTVQLKDPYGNRITDEMGSYVNIHTQQEHDPHPAILYSLD